MKNQLNKDAPADGVASAGAGSCLSVKAGQVIWVSVPVWSAARFWLAKG